MERRRKTLIITDEEFTHKRKLIPGAEEDRKKFYYPTPIEELETEPIPKEERNTFYYPEIIMIDEDGNRAPDIGSGKTIFDL